MFFEELNYSSTQKNIFRSYFFLFFYLNVHINIWSYAFHLNLMTSWTIFKTNTPYINGIKFLSCKLTTSFLTFLILIISSKHDKSFPEVIQICRILNINLNKYPLLLCWLWFFTRVSPNSEKSSIHIRLYMGKCCDIAQT